MSQKFWKSSKINKVIFSSALGFALLFLIVTRPVFTLLMIFFILGIWLLSHHLETGVFVLVALAPMIGWHIYLTPLKPYLEDYTWIANINAPAADFWAAFLFMAFVVWSVRQWWSGKKITFRAPGVLWFGLFLLSALVSFTHLPALELSAGIKYFFRFLVFAYAGYVLVGVNVIRAREIWGKALKVLFGVGVFGAAIGALSLVRGAWYQWGFVRAVPFDLFGWAPFGYQHILLAEVLTLVVPIGIYLAYREVNLRKKRWITYATIGALFIDLLTLSRAAWLTLFVAAVVFLFVTQKQHVAWKKIVAHKWIFVPLVLLTGYTGVFFATHPSVSSSTEARSVMNSISWELFRYNPVIGHGVGSFVTRLGEVDYFRLEFGDPLDAHGVVQKLLVEQGIFGLFTFGLFLGWILYQLVRLLQITSHTGERDALLLSLFLFGMVWFFQLFNTQYYASTVWIPTMLVLARLKM